MSHHTLQYGNTEIAYTLTYTKRETLAIHVHPDLLVSVEAPLESALHEVEKRLRKRAAWVLRQQRNFKRYSLNFPPRQYVSGETYRYLGQQYRLKVLQSEGEIETVHLEREQIWVMARHKNRVKPLLQNWYRQQAQAIFKERVAIWLPHFERFGISQPEVVVRQMRSQWGSCTKQGKITINLKLIMVHRNLIDYVVVHELCHLVEHNHGKHYYELLSKIMPSWREVKEKLDQFDFG